MNLIPPDPTPTPNYWCAWATQGYTLEPEHQGQARHNLDEATVFGPGGWTEQLDLRLRSDLLIVLDDGWDVPRNPPRHRFGELLPDPQRFPSAQGTPELRLAALATLATENGWRGVGVWVCAHPPAEDMAAVVAMSPQQLRDFYRERVRQCRAASLRYWKVDWGEFQRDLSYRRMLTEVAAEEYPDLVVEHASCSWPLNDWRGTGRFRDLRFDDAYVQLQDCAEQLRFAQVLRAYDILEPFATVTMFDRVAELMRAGRAGGRSDALIHAEDEVYLAAALGCSMGVMRHPAWRFEPGRDEDPRQVRRRMDEVVRAVRWQRIAPAFGVGTAVVAIDPHTLSDTWHFLPGDTWWDQPIGHELTQRAPARVARGLDLPRAEGRDGLPFVAASRHPDGPVAVATLWRAARRQLDLPRATVELALPEADQPIGVFGDYEALRLVFPGDVAGQQVWAQDLAGEEAEEVTARITLDGRSLVIPGEVIREVGTRAGTPGDVSDAGLVLRLEPRC